MAKSQETFNKKEKEKNRLRKQQDKKEKKEERKANAKKGQSLDDMMAYVDENGNLVDSPPDPRKKRIVRTEDIQIGVTKQEDLPPQDVVRKGVVTFFNEAKGFGFIKDQQTQESVFVHINGLLTEVKENDKVTFEVERGPKGLNALSVRKAV